MVLRTPLHDWHVAAGARMIEFGGWEMPLQFTGIIEEHLAVRQAVGLFDVSHMGKLFVEGPDAHTALDTLSTNTISSRPGKARYALLLRDDATVIDDVIVTCLSPDRFFIVCNAGPRPSVTMWLRDHLPRGVVLADRTQDFLCLALQGPRAPELLQRFTEVDVAALKPFEGTVLSLVPPSEALVAGTGQSGRPLEMQGWGLPGAPVGPIPPQGPAGSSTSGGGPLFLVTRTGYTGEAGFELFPPAAWGRWVWTSLLEEGSDLAVRPVGLGARDTLRLEKGYLLSGQDFDGRQTPLEVGAERFVKWDRSFVGRAALLAQKELGAHDYLVGVRMEDRAIPRHGCRVYREGRGVGTVTSGTLSPSLRVGIALASVDRESAREGTPLEVEIRDARHPAQVVPLPFL